MRWKTNNFKDGDIRIISKFALFPVESEENGENRWLEWVTIKQQLSCNYAGYGWHNLRFLNK